MPRPRRRTAHRSEESPQAAKGRRGDPTAPKARRQACQATPNPQPQTRREESPQAAEGCRGDPAAPQRPTCRGPAAARPTAARSPHRQPKAAEETPQPHKRGAKPAKPARTTHHKPVARSPHRQPKAAEETPYVFVTRVNEPSAASLPAGTSAIVVPRRPSASSRSLKSCGLDAAMRASSTEIRPATTWV
jgi:hypothetical protein